jgi:hypothetical protein
MPTLLRLVLSVRSRDGGGSASRAAKDVEGVEVVEGVEGVEDAERSRDLRRQRKGCGRIGEGCGEHAQRVGIRGERCHSVLFEDGLFEDDDGAGHGSGADVLDGLVDLVEWDALAYQGFQVQAAAAVEVDQERQVAGRDRVAALRAHEPA